MIPSLRSFAASYNDLTGTIPSELLGVGLSHLYLDYNQLQGIPTGSSEHSWDGIQYIYLRHNRLSGSIPSVLGAKSTLQKLHLSSNQELSGSIPAELGSLSLQELDLSFTNLTGGIPASIGNLASLTSLKMTNTQLGGSIPPQIGQLTQLTFLNLASSGLVGTIPPHMGNMTSLRVWGMADNRLTGTIPAELAELSNLYLMYFSSNQLNGSIPSSLPRKLYKLGLAKNHLTGSIPTEIGTLPMYRQAPSSSGCYLHLAYNYLSGQIPKSIGNLRCLTQLDLRLNQFTGTLPPELSALSNLQVLKLSKPPAPFRGNHTGRLMISGTLPPEFGDLSNLNTLDVQNNGLSGTIPSSFGNLRKLYYINLIGNDLEGWQTPPKPPALSTFLFDVDSLLIPCRHATRVACKFNSDGHLRCRHEPLERHCPQQLQPLDQADNFVDELQSNEWNPTSSYRRIAFSASVDGL